MPGSTISLSQVAERADILVLACSRCERRGRLRIARLIAEHGPGMSMPTVLGLLTADCSKHGEMGAIDQCGAHFPELPELFGVAEK